MDLLGDDPNFQLPFELLLDDPPVIVVNKPAGLLTLGGKPEVPTLERMVKEALKGRFQKEGNVYLGIPHRLDRPVSGAILFTRNSKSAARMAEQFEERQVRKVYWAILENEPEESSGVLEHLLRKVPEQARVEVVSGAAAAEGKSARLRYSTIGRTALGPVVEIELETGRMHQIRVQFSAIGCPVVGDRQYGAGTMLSVETEGGEVDERSVPIGLHARLLSFKHPVRYDEVSVTAPLPEYWPSIEFRS
jgi:23S rRNA pseudouridine1911/1915/1917 synthase